ncbi:hypothetical protein P2318_34715 [Myxococcaceae bacterium GXIMD 01537]
MHRALISASVLLLGSAGCGGPPSEPATPLEPEVPGAQDTSTEPPPPQPEPPKPPGPSPLECQRAFKLTLNYVNETGVPQQLRASYINGYYRKLPTTTFDNTYLLPQEVRSFDVPCMFVPASFIHTVTVLDGNAPGPLGTKTCEIGTGRAIVSARCTVRLKGGVMVSGVTMRCELTIASSHIPGVTYPEYDSC